ncbi:hypothetical protein B0J11DRAFT_602707 [Dendryphion nanum]|uniref:PARP-type domain-containing protein n=1 Tax=Dendryphion nanum TaxID=256645 RepID=A0A9P9E2S8_9PLEO|nr:hypothetical protein B0J11DRAFT_602707 [Dendryphion nanum]
MEESMPVLRLEHSANGLAGCQRAACKREGVKILKGELRVGKYQLFEQENKYITLWRHWKCTPPTQIKGLKTIAGDVPENAPGFVQLSPESQEQVRATFEAERVTDMGFTDVRPDLVTASKSFGDITEATGYKVELASTGRAGCRSPICSEKILKGELRLGIATSWDGEHDTWSYKHWKCISPYDLNSVKENIENDKLFGLFDLKDEYTAVIQESIKQGKVLEPPAPPPPTPKAKKPRKRKFSGTDDFVAKDDENDNISLKSPPKKKRTRAKKVVDSPLKPELSGPPEEEHIIAKALVREEEEDPAVKRIMALAEGMRAEAARVRNQDT